MKETVMVSVLTTAYNHAPYIAQALDSFLMQKTDFKFEVIVHDDASTDGTADIIRQYAEKYPEIIKPIFQTENQYSQGNSPYDYMDPYIRGKYIAQCEGDDYWCDKNKLQMQFDYMENHPECSYCFCNSYDVDVDGKVIGEKRPAKESRVFNSEEIIRASGDFCANAGSFYRTSDIESVESFIPQTEVGDVPLRCLLALRGNAYGFQNVMVCYRRFVPGSWTQRVQKSRDRDGIIEWKSSLLDFYKYYREIAEEKYRNVIDEMILKTEFSLFVEKNDWKKIREPAFRQHFACLSRRAKTIVFVKFYFPWAIKGVRLVRYGKKGLSRKY